MKSSTRAFRSRAQLFFASMTVYALIACIAEVASATSATDTAVAEAPATSTSTTNVAASSTSATDSAVKPVIHAAQVPANQDVGIRLVDTTETENYYANKVEVTFAGRVDTIPGVLTFDMPVVTSDGVLHGPNISMEEHYVGIYSYDPLTRAVSNIPLPNDASGWASEVKLSPDATHIAYVGGWGDLPGSRGIIRSWPAAAVVFTTMSAPQAPSDYSFNQVWWVNADSVEFAWHTDLGSDTKPIVPRFPFIAIYTSLRARRFTVGTLEKPRIFKLQPSGDLPGAR